MFALPPAMEAYATEIEHRAAMVRDLRRCTDIAECTTLTDSLVDDPSLLMHLAEAAKHESELEQAKVDPAVAERVKKRRLQKLDRYINTAEAYFSHLEALIETVEFDKPDEAAVHISALRKLRGSIDTDGLMALMDRLCPEKKA